MNRIRIAKQILVVAKRIVDEIIATRLNDYQKGLVDKFYKQALPEDLQFGLFKNGRTYFPIKHTPSDIQCPEVIKKILEDEGCRIKNYRDGIAYDKNEKEVSIGKILDKILKRISKIETEKNILDDWEKEDKREENETDREYEKRVQNNKRERKEKATPECVEKIKNGKYKDGMTEIEKSIIQTMFKQRLGFSLKEERKLLMCITSLPEDVAAMSTNRKNWDSCMRLPKEEGDCGDGGMHYDTALQQVKYGGMCAYLIDADDKEIDRPYARIAIKRFVTVLPIERENMTQEQKNNIGYAFFPETIIYGIVDFAKECNFFEEVKKVLDESNKTTLRENKQVLMNKNPYEKIWSDGLSDAQKMNDDAEDHDWNVSGEESIDKLIRNAWMKYLYGKAHTNQKDGRKEVELEDIEKYIDDFYDKNIDRISMKDLRNAIANENKNFRKFGNAVGSDYDVQEIFAYAIDSYLDRKQNTREGTGRIFNKNENGEIGYDEIFEGMNFTIHHCLGYTFNQIIHSIDEKTLEKLSHTEELIKHEQFDNLQEGQVEVSESDTTTNRFFNSLACMLDHEKNPDLRSDFAKEIAKIYITYKIDDLCEWDGQNNTIVKDLIEKFGGVKNLMQIIEKMDRYKIDDLLKEMIDENKIDFNDIFNMKNFSDFTMSFLVKNYWIDENHTQKNPKFDLKQFFKKAIEYRFIQDECETDEAKKESLIGRYGLINYMKIQFNSLEEDNVCSDTQAQELRNLFDEVSKEVLNKLNKSTDTTTTALIDNYKNTGFNLNDFFRKAIETRIKEDECKTNEDRQRSAYGYLRYMVDYQFPGLLEDKKCSKSDIRKFEQILYQVFTNYMNSLYKNKENRK